MKKPERMKNKTTKAFLYQNLYVEQLEDFIECKKKEKRMTRKMTKQDGN